MLLQEFLLQKPCVIARFFLKIAVRFEVFTAVTIDNTASLGVVPSSLVIFGTGRLPSSSGTGRENAFFFVEGTRALLRNVGKCLLKYTAPFPKLQYVTFAS